MSRITRADSTCPTRLNSSSSCGSVTSYERFPTNSLRPISNYSCTPAAGMVALLQMAGGNGNSPEWTLHSSLDGHARGERVRNGSIDSDEGEAWWLKFQTATYVITPRALLRIL